MLKDKLYCQLELLRIKTGRATGLFKASIGEYYRKIWVRDSFYCSLPYLEDSPTEYVETIQRLLDYYIYMELKHNKFTWIIREPWNKEAWRYLHPRMTTDLEEINEQWGNKQHDCFGEVLYAIYLGESAGLKIIRNFLDVHIINKIIEVLGAVEYWHDPDNGIWEEYEEVHASSVGACVAGLKAIRYCGIEVPQYLIDKGEETLRILLPRESITKRCDLALMTLIYPFNILDVDMAKIVLSNIVKYLLRPHGVIRYDEDAYYNIANHKEAIPNNRYHDPTLSQGDYRGHEAEWCFGIAYLSLAYDTIGECDKARYYYNMLLEQCVLEDGRVPELYYSGTDIYNDNTPLGWSVAMTRIADRRVGGN